MQQLGISGSEWLELKPSTELDREKAEMMDIIPSNSSELVWDNRVIYKVVFP
jgi:hypothetical protein